MKMDSNAQSMCEDVLVTLGRTCSTAGGEEQHSQRSADCIRSSKRATESIPGETYCSGAGEFLQLVTKYMRLRLQM